VASPKLQIFRDIVNDLLEQGVYRPSKSPYASPAFLVPKGADAFRMVVDYRKVIAKIVYDSYPMPTIDQAFDQLGGAVVFSVFDFNMAYHQIPLSARSRRATAFCTPFGLFEFNKLPTGISIGSQVLSRVIDELFADLKGKSVFNFLDDLVVYSSSKEEHGSHVSEVLRRLQDAGLTLKPDKVTLGAKEIKYLGHLISPGGISVLPDRVVAIKSYPRPANLRSLRRFLGMVGFYGRFIPEFFRAVRKISAKAVCKSLEDVFLPAYGTPGAIVTDNARVFRCRAFKDLCFRWGMTHITTTPYYHQASQAERVNRNLKAALKIFHHN
jgi:hypothetical protein